MAITLFLTGPLILDIYFMHFIPDIPLWLPAYNALFFTVFSTFFKEKSEKNGEKCENLIDSRIKEPKKHIKNKKNVKKFEKQKKFHHRWESNPRPLP